MPGGALIWTPRPSRHPFAERLFTTVCRCAWRQEEAGGGIHDFGEFWRRFAADRLLPKSAPLRLFCIVGRELVAQAHGGQAEVESQPGSGAVFRLILPPPPETAGQGATGAPRI